MIPKKPGNSGCDATLVLKISQLNLKMILKPENLLIHHSKQGINYALKWLPRGWWYFCGKPYWHKGRNVYISIGLWLVALYRGY